MQPVSVVKIIPIVLIVKEGAIFTDLGASVHDSRRESYSPSFYYKDWSRRKFQFRQIAKLICANWLKDKIWNERTSILPIQYNMRMSFLVFVTQNEFRITLKKVLKVFFSRSRIVNHILEFIYYPFESEGLRGTNVENLVIPI